MGLREEVGDWGEGGMLVCWCWCWELSVVALRGRVFGSTEALALESVWRTVLGWVGWVNGWRVYCLNYEVLRAGGFGLGESGSGWE